MLLPPKPGSKLSDLLLELRANVSPPNATFWDGVQAQAENGVETNGPDLARKRAWRIDPETLASFRLLAQQYEGTHCFHNYTVGRDFSDRAAQRYMLKIEVTAISSQYGKKFLYQ